MDAKFLKNICSSSFFYLWCWQICVYVLFCLLAPTSCLLIPPVWMTPQSMDCMATNSMLICTAVEFSTCVVHFAISLPRKVTLNWVFVLARNWKAGGDRGPVFTWELRIALLTGHLSSIGTVSSQTPVHWNLWNPSARSKLLSSGCLLHHPPSLCLLDILHSPLLMLSLLLCPTTPLPQCLPFSLQGIWWLWQ